MISRFAQEALRHPMLGLINMIIMMKMIIVILGLVMVMMKIKIVFQRKPNMNLHT